MPIIRAQAVFQGSSGLPEDQFVNVFHFDTGVFDYDTAAPLLAARLIEFYTAVTSPSAAAIDWFMSNALLPAARIKTYDLADPEPRIPNEYPFTIDPEPQSGDQNLPEEVAVCLSYHGDPPITARRRGRIYIGPLNSRASDETIATPARPAASFRNVLCEAALRLRNNVEAYDWVIRSTVPSVNYVAVSGGWVDNAWDTQRRRGIDPTARTVWPNPI